jgi:hypothetical protein
VQELHLMLLRQGVQVVVRLRTTLGQVPLEPVDKAVLAATVMHCSVQGKNDLVAVVAVVPVLWAAMHPPMQWIAVRVQLAPAAQGKNGPLVPVSTMLAVAQAVKVIIPIALPHKVALVVAVTEPTPGPAVPLIMGPRARPTLVAEVAAEHRATAIQVLGAAVDLVWSSSDIRLITPLLWPPLEAQFIQWPMATELTDLTVQAA